MRLTGPQIGEFRKILCNAFTRDELTPLLHEKLNFKLDAEVSADQGWEMAAYQLIGIFDRQGRAIDLIRVVRQARPDFKEVPEFCDPLLAQREGQVFLNSLQQAVGAFRAEFQQRKDLFRYLNAYKELHDILHDLQTLHLQALTALAARTGSAANPPTEDVAPALRDLVTRAQETVVDTEFPDRPPRWITQLAKAVDDALGPDAAKVARAVDRLDNLPATQLAQLNDTLIGYARRLRTSDLFDLLDAVQAVLPPAGTNRTLEKLRSEVARFRGLCLQCAGLIDVHDLCQSVQNALREGAGLRSITPEALTEWPETKTWLTEIGKRRPTDPRAQRTIKAADGFEAAPSESSFTNLVEKFSNLFRTTDKMLRDVTNKLPNAADCLETAMESFR
jgi:hypothetical protein